MRRLTCCVLLFLSMATPARPQSPAPGEPLRLGMAGLVHGHASGFLTRNLKRQDVRLVGIAEPDQAVAARYRERFGLDPSTLFPSVEQMLDQTRPQAVVVFTDTFGVSRLRLAAAVEIQPTRLVSRTSFAGVTLPGVRDAGTYVFVKADAPLGVAVGTVRKLSEMTSGSEASCTQRSAA